MDTTAYLKFEQILGLGHHNRAKDETYRRQLVRLEFQLVRFSAGNGRLARSKHTIHAKTPSIEASGSLPRVTAARPSTQKKKKREMEKKTMPCTVSKLTTEGVGRAAAGGS